MQMQKNATVHTANLSASVRIANGSLNGLASLLTIGGLVPLIVMAGSAAAAGTAPAAYVVGISLFGGVTIYRFVISTLHSFLSLRKPRPTLRALEEAGTFFLPAGIYMPFMLSSLSGFWGWLLLGMTLFYAVSGFLLYLTIIGVFRRYAVSFGYLLFFVLMPFFEPIRQRLGEISFLWLVPAAAMYLLALVFKNRPNSPFADSLWQAFVIAGVILQYFAILVIPAGL
ncbi:MAG: hypothetical protein KKI09_03635 [Spirochaetes bacterium]|nr:hypothetical protein [Spirochaetota bacterium]MBU0954499.1 hypothetical protein [Spirochaetota bacterium]